MKCKILAVLFLVVIQSAFAVPTFADGAAGPCKSVDIDFMHQHLNLPKQVSIVSKVPVNNLCQVVLNINGRYFTTYASDKYVVIGKMYVNHTLSDSAELARLTKANFIKVSPEMEKSIAFRYKPEGKIKEVVYMITDPLCPYCNVATKKMKEFSDNYHAELRVIFSSVHGTAGDQKAIEEGEHAVIHTQTDQFAVRDRITVTMSVLQSAQKQFFFLKGEKKKMFKEVTSSDFDPISCPAHGVLEGGRSVWITLKS